LSSTNTEKHLRVSHNKESHKVKVLARIYFSMAGKGIERGGGPREKETFLAFTVLYWRAGGYT
jgi:hypothetical protein